MRNGLCVPAGGSPSHEGSAQEGPEARSQRLRGDSPSRGVGQACPVHPAPKPAPRGAAATTPSRCLPRARKPTARTLPEPGPLWTGGAAAVHAHGAPRSHLPGGGVIYGRGNQAQRQAAATEGAAGQLLNHMKWSFPLSLSKPHPWPAPPTEPHTKRSLPSGAHPDISRPLTARPPGALLKFITMSQAPHHLPPAPRPPQRGDDL